jgi:crotonobetainyl-CoA:carnitine CoA-transferase CaiB-like acyl-CoA transferase
LLDNPRWFFTDYAAGVLGAFASMLGLYHRSRTGSGARAETCLVNATMLEQVLYLIGGARDPGREPRGDALGWSPLHRLYRTANGHIFLAAPAEQRGAVLAALGALPDTPNDQLVVTLAAAIGALSTDECCRRLASPSVGIHPVTRLTQLMAPGAIADQRGLRIEDRTDASGTIVMPGPVARLSRTPMRPGAIPTPFGADRDAVLAILTGDHR